MDGADYFSPDYRSARARFRATAAVRDAAVEAFPIAAGTDDLTIDAAVLGADRPRRLVLVTSGLHGVEGFFGSAVQLALFDDVFAAWQPPDGATVVLLHALCPFGFHHLRRTNEENIDLNRNFLKPGAAYSGSPPGYAELDALLNPPRPPKRPDLFVPRLYLKGLIGGQRRLRQAIAGGQYQFPRGLFYGGSGPAASHRVLAEQLPRWFESAERIIHLDFHTGLGRWATYKVLTAHRNDDPATRTLRGWFGAAVEAASTGPTAYDSRGGIDEWLEDRAAGRECYSVCAEFGTYGPLTVLSALRAENQAHHWGDSDGRAKRRLSEVFGPVDRDWRRAVVRQGVEIVRQAIEACFVR
jgi:predicted deacylase